MKRRILLTCLSVLWIAIPVFTVPAAELTDLPEILGTWRDFKVTREAAAKDLLPFLAGYNFAQRPPELEKRVHKAVDDRVFRHVLELKLKEKNISVNRKTAEEYIAGQQLFPLSQANEKLTGQLEKLAGQPDFQFKAALHCYFVWVAPELVMIKKEEVERFYRLNRQLYRQPDEFDLDVLKLPDTPAAAEQLDTAESLLKQGEEFEAVSQRFGNQSARGEKLPAAALEAFPRMKEGEFLRCKDGKYLYLIKLDKRLPGRVTPLEEAAPFIAMNLNSVRVRDAARVLLGAELSRCPVVYTPLWPAACGRELREGQTF